MADENNANPDSQSVPAEIPEEKQDSPSKDSSKPQGNVIPEEIPEEAAPEDLTAKDIGDPIGSDLPPLDDEALGGGGGSNLRRYILIGGGILVLIVVFIVIFQILRSIRGGGSNEEIALEYWGLWEDEQVMQPIIEEYQREHSNVTINYVKQDPQDYREKLVARSKEGRGPDIYRFHNTWLPSIAEISAPLPKDIMSDDEYNSTFYEVAQNDLKFNDAYHGIPLMIDGLVLIYNDELFRKAGIVTEPETWDDLLRAANSLLVPDPEGNIITSGISLGTANNIEHFSDILAWMLLQNGATITSLESPEAIEVLANYRQFAEPPLSFWNENMPNNVTAFIQGKVAMIMAPSWRILEIKQANPELDVKVTSLPILSGNQPLSLANYWVEGVTKSSKHQDAAWEFLKYLSEKETMTKLYEEQSKVRAFGEPYSRVDLREALIENEYVGPVLEQALFMQSMPLVSRTFDNGLNDENVAYLRDAVNASAQGVSYEQAISNAARGINEVLARYNIEE